jgi:stage IV sporulation protein FB
LTRISIHPLFFLIYFLALIHGFLYDVLLLFVIVLIHELGHACTALSFGWRVKKIELLPFGGVAEVDEHGNRPIQEEALVIAAGPLMNIIMIGVTFVFLHFNLWNNAFAYQFLEYNLLILLFNLLPIWPLDGGKLIQLFLSLLSPFKKAIRHSLLVSGGCFIMYVFVVFFYYPYYFFLWVVAIFLLISQWMELRQAYYQYMRFLIERHQRTFRKKKEADVVSIIVHPHQSIKDVLGRMFRHKFHYFCLLNHNGQLQHIISEQEMLDYFFAPNNAYRAVRDIFG